MVAKVSELVAHDALNVDGVLDLEDGHNDPTDVARSIRKELQTAAKVVEDRRVVTDLEGFLEGGGAKIRLFAEALQGRWRHFPVLHRVDVNRLLDYVLALPVDDLRTLNSMLGARYQGTNPSDQLSSERAALLELARKLELGFKSEIPISPREWMLGHVVTALRKAADNSAASA